MNNDSYFVHESSYVDEGVSIGSGTKIWHFCHVMKGAEIGEKCTLGQNVFVAGGVQIGRGVKIQNNVSIYDGVILEDDVFCGPSMVFTNVKNPRSFFPRNREEDYLITRVKKGATIGANATIVCGITIEEYAFIAAGAVITKHVPAHAVMAGVPARFKGWACVCGESLCVRKDEIHCPFCGRLFLKRGRGLAECGTEGC